MPRACAVSVRRNPRALQTPLHTSSCATGPIVHVHRAGHRDRLEPEGHAVGTLARDMIVLVGACKSAHRVGTTCTVGRKTAKLSLKCRARSGSQKYDKKYSRNTGYLSAKKRRSPEITRATSATKK
jgi:hypothetical protein